MGSSTNSRLRPSIGRTRLTSSRLQRWCVSSSLAPSLGRSSVLRAVLSRRVFNLASSDLRVYWEVGIRRRASWGGWND